MPSMRSILSLSIITVGLALPVAAEETISYPVCDIQHEDVLMSDVDGSPITLKIHLHSDGTGPPVADRELVFADGERLVLYSAVKIIDFWGAEGPPGCEEHLEEVNYGYHGGHISPRTVADLSEIALQQLSGIHECERPSSDSMKCYDPGAVHVAETLTPAEFARLRDQKATLITLMMSTYYEMTFAYDAEKRALIELYSEGC
ncbi:MAG: hypothetical protein AAFZ91_09260 [Pseudomonadota bacterium]